MKHLLTFEFDEKQETLEILGDRQGLELLKKTLDMLISKGPTHDHDHLMTEAWGGHELTDEKLRETNTLINHVKIYCRK